MLNDPFKKISLDRTIQLECDTSLEGVEVAYHAYGTLNDTQSNVVLVLHALTGTSAAQEWWNGLIGTGRILDPNQYFIIAPNLLGSCYGTTGPESIDPKTGALYLASFPSITPRDIARVNLALLDKLNIERVHLAIGGSLGGMVVLEMASLAPDRFDAIVPIAVSGQHSAWRLAFSSFVRKTIVAHDPTLQDRTKLLAGLRLARQAAMITYRSSAEFDFRFGRETSNGRFEVENYLEHQGEKIVARFSPYSYLTLTRAMELYDLSRDQRSLEEVAASISVPALFVGISSDILYEPEEIELFAKLFPNSDYQTLDAIHGHDSFLVDQDVLAEVIRPFLHTRNVKTLLEAVV